MALFGLLGGDDDGADPLDIYGDLFTDKQKAALKKRELTQGFFRVAEALGKAAQPSPYKPSIGSMAGALGAGLGAFGAGGDEAANKQLQAMQIAEKVRQSRQERAILAKAAPYVEAITQKLMQGGVPAAQAAQLAPQIATQIGAPSANAPPAPAPGSGYTGPTNAELGAPPPSPYLGPTNDELGAPPTQLGNNLPPAPALSGPITPAERLQWQKTVGPGNQYLPIEDWVAKQRAGQKQTGLLPPVDQVVGPDGQPLTGQGVLPRMLASYAGTGGTPGGMPPFQPTPPSSATPGADGLDVVIPSGPRLQRSDLTNVAGPAPGDRSDAAWEYYKPLIKKYESGGRNIEQQVVGPQGGYNPSTGTVTGPSSASGYLQMINPTWRSAAKAAGIDLEKYPRAINAPEAVQDEAGKALFKQRGLADWLPYNSRLAAAVGHQGGGQDVVIPSGRGIPASALTNVADTGGAPTASGNIPGLGVPPEALAALNAMLKMGGMKSDPFGSLLESYYKSPSYLGEKARTEAQAGKDVALEMDPKIAAETARQTQKYIQENETHKSGLDLARDLIGKGVYFDKETGMMKPITNAAEAMAAIDAVKPTGDIKEYEYYRKQTLATGQIPDPFQKWDAARRKASATTINTAEGFDAAQTKARVGVDAKIAQDLAEQAITGRRLMPVLDELAYLADKTPEGWKGPLAITTGRTLAGFGVAVPAGASNAEAFQALAQRLVPVVREPGATSQGEMNLYLNAGPSLAGTADGRRLIIDINRSMIQRSQEIAKVYRENIGKPDLYERLAELDKPLFSPEQRAAMEGASKARAVAPGATAAPPGAAAPTAPTITGPNGEKLVLSPDGKQWVPQ